MQRRQKQRELILGIGTIGILLIAGAIWYLTKDYRFETYTDKTGGFSIDYPSTWSYRENVEGASVVFYSPQEFPGDFFIENANVVIQPLGSEAVSLPDYSRTAIDQMKIVFGHNLEIIESEETMFAGKSGYKFYFIGRGPQTDMQFNMLWVLTDTSAYQFTFLVQDGKFEQYKSKFNSMFKSLKILSP